MGTPTLGLLVHPPQPKGRIPDPQAPGTVFKAAAWCNPPQCRTSPTLLVAGGRPASLSWSPFEGLSAFGIVPQVREVLVTSKCHRLLQLWPTGPNVVLGQHSICLLLHIERVLAAFLLQSCFTLANRVSQTALQKAAVAGFCWLGYPPPHPVHSGDFPLKM